jgi:dihydroorotase
MSVDVTCEPEEGLGSDVGIADVASSPSRESCTRPAPQAEGLAREISLPALKNMHVHVRQDRKLRAVVPGHMKYCAHILPMPNTDPPILSADDLVGYRAEILRAGVFWGYFEPIMTFMLTGETSTGQIQKLAAAGAVAAKLYPRGATTNSQYGVRNLLSAHMLKLYKALEDYGIVLCIHLEDPAGEIMTRERDYIWVAEKIVRGFNYLRIVIEHVSMAETAVWVSRQRDGVAATITPQHLLCTTDDVLGMQGLEDPFLPTTATLVDGRSSPGIRPHYYFLPVAKQRRDRRVLINFALENEKFCFCTDSAPHDPETKECPCGCAGVYVPDKVALGILVWVFETYGGSEWEQQLTEFTSGRAARFYGLKPSGRRIFVQRRDWTVPPRMDGFVPFAAGHTLPWEPE